MGDRWPPVYSQEQLTESINSFVTHKSFEDFWVFFADGTSPKFQGDVFTLPLEFAFLSHDKVLRERARPEFWMIIGNTCDIHREVKDVPYTQICPVNALPDDVPASILGSLKSYSASRIFYLPPWEVGGKSYTMDFNRIISFRKESLDAITRVCGLSNKSWALFNACVVRYLARDDGRND